MRSLHRVPVLVLFCATLALTARAGDAILLSDIATGFAGASSSPSNFVDVGGKCFFSATDGTNGFELYTSDGFSSGTALVRDIFSGPGSSSPSNLINVGGTLYFTANDGATGTELWKSDGTNAGTVQVRDIRVGPGGSSPSTLTVFGGVLFFSADDGVNGRELWKTDGTAAGTVQVKDINTAAAGSSLATNSRIVEMGGNLYFPANDGTNGVELWRSDGTDAGTVLVRNIHTTAGSSSLNNNNEIVALGSLIIFPATDATNGRELWKSDGTEVGTVIIQNLNSGTANANPDQLTVAGTFVYFRATAGSILGTDTELYRTNGTGTTLFNLNVQTSGLVTVSSSPQQLTAVGADLFCRANVNTGANSGTAIGNELVRITAGGVRTDYDINTGSLNSTPSLLTAVGTTLLFNATTAADGNELYSVTSGSGTATLHSVNSGTASASPANIRAFDATRAVFTANTTTAGFELYQWNAGAVNLIRDINPGSDNAQVNGLTIVNLAVGGNTFFFSATDGFGVELFKSDLTSSGTIRVRDLNGSANSGLPSELTDVGGTLFFRAAEGTQGSELYRSNGTPAGTVLSNDIIAGSGSSTPTELTVFNGSLYFSAADATNGSELQVLNGGTVSNVANLEPGVTGSGPLALRAATGNLYFIAITSALGARYYTFNGTTTLEATEGASPPFTYSLVTVENAAIGGTLYFVASTVDNTATNQGIELWRLDGTAASLVVDLNTATGASSQPLNLTPFNGQLFFSADDGVNGRELWKSDGTSGGTTRVKDIIAGSGASDPANLTVVGNTLYFTASDGATGVELWKTDGTDAGTVLVKDIFPGMVGSNPHSLLNLNGTLVFAASDGVNGFELWKSDGNDAGTVLVKDINPGAGSSMPPLGLEIPILAAGGAGRAVFAASNGVSGTELWKTNGTSDGTAQIQDINPGASSSTPDGFTVSGSFVYFRANNGANGTELWALSLSALLDPPAITTLPVAAGAANAAFNFIIGLSGTDPIVVTTSELPPGLILSGSTISGTPTTPGVYTVTITATNSSGSATQTLKIVITGDGISNGTIDTDGDGFADEVETSLGLDPMNAGSTPFGGTPAGSTIQLNVQKLTISLDFVKPNRDQLSFSGLIGLPAGFASAGQTITLSVGGAIRTFTLDAKGQIAPKSKTESFKLSSRANSTTDQLGKYAVKFSKGNFGSSLLDEGLTKDATVTAALKSVTVTMLFNSRVYTSAVTQLFTAQANKKGKTQQPADDSGSGFPTR